MNNFLKQIDYKLQTAILIGIIFTGVMFLVPVITQKAMATIFGTLTGNCRGDRGHVVPCKFLPLQKNLTSGRWIEAPNLEEPCVECKWVTNSNFFGNEEGTIVFQVLNYDPDFNDIFTVYFHNPRFGSNKCSITPTYPFNYFRSCDAEFGFILKMTHHLSQNVWYPNTAKDEEIPRQGVGSTNDKVVIDENGGSGGDSAHTGAAAAAAAMANNDDNGGKLSTQLSQNKDNNIITHGDHDDNSSAFQESINGAEDGQGGSDDTGVGISGNTNSGNGILNGIGGN